MSPIIGNITGLLPGRSERLARDPVGAQARTLQSLLRRASTTEWGVRYDFASIARHVSVVERYQARMPLNDYEAFRRDVDRTLRGETDILWPGSVRCFAVSSGTVSEGKLIPMSPAMVKAQRRGSVEASIRYLFPRRLSALRGKLLTVPGRAEAHPGYPDVLVGEMSGILALSAPAVVSHFWQAVSLDTLLIDNWERKLDAIVEASVALDVRALAMAPTWAVVLFDKLLAAFRRRHGRAATSVLEVWPNLQVFFSGGVSLESYRQLLNDRIGDGRSVDFLEFYGASEGLFGTQSAPGETDMLLNLKADVFYEFVRMDELESSDPTRFTVADVELDVRYALFATTCSGLWSYGMRDVVRFTSLLPHRIVVAGRTTEMLDKYGEALFGDEVRAGLEFACRKTGALVSEYHVSPRSAGVGGMPALEWLIEFEKVPEDLAAFARSVDTHIQSVNRHYQIRREARALEGPELCVVPRGSFYRWLKATRASVGAQTKILRMSADRSISDGVIKVAGEREDAMRFPMGA